MRLPASRVQVFSKSQLLAAMVLPLVLLGCLAASGQENAKASRSHDGLVVLYDFAESDGPVVKDRSGAGEPLDLRINDMRGVQRAAGELTIRGKAAVRSDGPARKLIDAVKASGELTIEAWVAPANTSQEGPARIISLSKNTSERNFTLGQEKDQYDARLRTTRTSTNGMPSLNSGGRAVSTELTHVVYTRSRNGQARLYINGERKGEKRVDGDMKNWDNAHGLALANEFTGDRQWQGTFYLVAIYSRSLSGEEVVRHFKAGASSKAIEELLAARRVEENTALFNRHIAPLLANRCLECHDTATNKGGLDLSRQIAAMAGGDNGEVIVPGEVDSSTLWEAVASGDMPKKRESLTKDELAHLKAWIEGGANWSLDMIDPTIYAHGGGSKQVFVQRLTVDEYVETVRRTLGVDIDKEARDLLPPDLRADGFSNTAYNLGVDLKHVEAYSRLAEMIVGRMDVEQFAGRFSKSRRLTDDDMRGLIETMGRWVLRGPLTRDEVDTYRGISTTVASTGGDFKEAVSYVLQAMIQSPRFIYRIEGQRRGGQRVGQYELASRLSYILWGGPPDEALMAAADKNELGDEKKLRQHVQRMLANPRAKAQSLRFAAQWLHLNRLANMQPNRDTFPEWNDALAGDMRAETLAFFEDVVWEQQRPLAELFDAQVTFATPELAKHYGLQANQITKRMEHEGRPFARFNLSKTAGRGGLLTQGSVLTIGGDEASMVTRGLFVLHDVLRGKVNDPPPCVDTTPVPSKAGRTQRDVAEARIANNQCGGCHQKFEPLAFGLEKFDGLGRFSHKDHHDNALREDGEVLFPGAAKPVAYKSADELMKLLAESDRVQQTLTWKLAQFALGRPLTATDAPEMAQIHKSASESGGTYTDVMTAIVVSDLVQRTQSTEDD